VPKSRLRRKTAAYTPPPVKLSTKLKSRAWVAPLMLALFIIGLLWIVVFYVTAGKYPITAIHNWNIAVGFGLIAAGFMVSTQWK
jgi:Cell division protein CrgA